MLQISPEDTVTILNKIEDGSFTEDDLERIKAFSDKTRYSNAEFFTFQVTHSFYYLIQVQVEEQPRLLDFDEVEYYMEQYVTRPLYADKVHLLRQCCQV